MFVLGKQKPKTYFPKIRPAERIFGKLRYKLPHNNSKVLLQVPLLLFHHKLISKDSGHTVHPGFLPFYHFLALHFELNVQKVVEHRQGDGVCDVKTPERFIQ